MHAVRIVVSIVVVNLLLFLIEGATKAASKLSALADVWLGVDDASWTTCALVLHVSVVLVYHLVQEVVVDHVALAAGVLLVGSYCGRDVVSLEADW